MTWKSTFLFQDDPEDRRGLKIFLMNKGKELAENELVPMVLEFKDYIRGTVEHEIAGISTLNGFN